MDKESLGAIGIVAYFIIYFSALAIVILTYPLSVLFVFLTNKKIMNMFCQLFDCGDDKSVDSILLRLIENEGKEKSLLKRMRYLHLYGDDIYRLLLKKRYKNDYLLLKLRYGGNKYIHGYKGYSN